MVEKMRLAALLLLMLAGLFPEWCMGATSYSPTPAERIDTTSAIYVRFRKYLNDFPDAYSHGDIDQTRVYFNLFDSLINSQSIKKDAELSQALYFSGLFFTLVSDYESALGYFSRSLEVRDRSGIRDYRYRRVLANYGNALYQLGDYYGALNYFDTLVTITEAVEGPYAIDNIDHFNRIASTYNELHDYFNAIESAKKGLAIHETTGEGAESEVGMLLQNLAISHGRMNDYVNAIMYLSRSYDLISTAAEKDYGVLINVLNSLAINNIKIGNREKAEQWFRNGLPHALRSVSDEAFLLIANYASFLAEEGRISEAERLVTDAIVRISNVYNRNTRIYTDNIQRYVAVLSRFNIDNHKAIEILENELVPYCLANKNDSLLFRDIHHTYAMALYRNSDNHRALRAIQYSLFRSEGDAVPLFDDPPGNRFVPDRAGMEILADKVRILRAIYRESGDTSILSRAIRSNRNLIGFLENVRVSLSEEESRMLLGDNYRKIYEEILADISGLYSVSGTRAYFRLALEYAERAKAAGLLASLRSERAAEYLIPDSLLKKEKETDLLLGAVREKITEEMAKPQRNQVIITELRNTEFDLAERKSELVKNFERNYPDYYAARYNTSVAGFNEIKKALGRRATYLNYILTDSAIYIFVVNSRHHEVKKVEVTPEFTSTLAGYRKLLLKPGDRDNPRKQFSDFTRAGHTLYNYLIAPVRDFITTKQLIVSPDGPLSYIPFETLLQTYQERDDLLYRELDFMIRTFDISYTYSATMYIETSHGRRRFSNQGLFFAPEYYEGIYPDSVLNSRQLRQDTLFDLPHARDEARFAHSLLGGEIFLSDAAVESVYKTRASGYSIVHLAMHTIINNNEPALSKLIFSNTSDGDEDGLLNTWEIYGVPLRAGMVVVSSCNTGYGKLRAGEGMMSLARGFVSAGAESVIMSLWEVDDKWGSETVMNFYRNLKGGMSRSGALRKAKLDIIMGSYQFQSHPYYWSTLLLYGNRKPMFHDTTLIISFMLLGLAVTGIAAKVIARFYMK